MRTITMAIIGLIGGLVGAPQDVWAQNLPGFTSVITNPYDVQGIESEAKAENAVIAREQAFEKALIKGFQTMVEQVEPDLEKHKAIKTPDTKTLGQLLQDFSTRNEKMSTTEYSAVFDLRFKPGRVARYMQSAPVASVAQPSQAQPQADNQNHSTLITSGNAPQTNPVGQILVLPFYQTPDRLVLWGESNPLRAAFMQAETQKSSFKFPLGDLGDTQLFRDEAGLKFNAAQFAMLLHKYDVTQALILVAVPDTHTAVPNGSFGKMGLAPAKLTVMNYVATLKNPRPQYLDSNWVSVEPNLIGDNLFEKAVQATLQQGPAITARLAEQDKRDEATVDADPLVFIPEKGQAEQGAGGASIGPGGPHYVPVRATFQTLTEWQNIRARLAEVPDIAGVRIKRLRAQEASIELVYTTSMEYVLTALAQKGLHVTPKSLGTQGASVPHQTEPAAGADELYTISLEQIGATINRSEPPLDVMF